MATFFLYDVCWLNINLQPKRQRYFQICWTLLRSEYNIIMGLPEFCQRWLNLKIIDISIPLSSETKVFPDDSPVEIETISHLGHGDSIRLDSISMNTHAGTHIDTPAHLFSDGRGTESIDMDELIGGVYVLELNSSEPLTESGCMYLDIPTGTKRVIVKNKAPNDWMDETAALWFVNRGINFIGWNGFSVDAIDNRNLPSHRVLLKHGVHLVENLNLTKVETGTYFLVCLPLKLIGSDAAPVRAVLFKDFPNYMVNEHKWIDRAHNMVNYHEEAEGFLERAGTHFPAVPQDTEAVCLLWVESDLLDENIYGSLQEINKTLLHGAGELDLTRGADFVTDVADEKILVYQCTWSLEWQPLKHISVVLSIDRNSMNLSGKIQSSGGSPISINFPFARDVMTRGLSLAYYRAQTHL